MTKISKSHLIGAITKAHKMGLSEKEVIGEEIFIEQPNLLASVLVQHQMGNTMEDVDVLLDILIVLHLAIRESGQKLVKISDKEQERQLNLLTSTVKFTDGMGSEFVENSLGQYIETHKNPILLAYVIGAMNDANFGESRKECSKYLLMCGINLVNCIANAPRIA